jgi:hypothetical protein
MWGADMIDIIDTIMDQAEERITEMTKVSDELMKVGEEIIEKSQKNELDLANTQLAFVGLISSTLIAILHQLEETSDE